MTQRNTSEIVSEPAPEPPPTPLWLQRLVSLSDDEFRIPGTQVRFGLDPIIGALAPGLGDALTATLAVSLVYVAWQRGVPTGALLRMLGNIALDAAVGSIPALGDVFDVAYRSNRKNLDLLQREIGDVTNSDVRRSNLGPLIITLVVLIGILQLALFIALLIALVGN